MDGSIWSNGGMILTGENWSAGRKTLYSVGDSWMDEYGAMVEWHWQGKTEVLGEKNLSQLYLSMQIPMWYGLGLIPINTTKSWQLPEKWHGLFQALMWMIRLMLLDIHCNLLYVIEHKLLQELYQVQCLYFIWQLPFLTLSHYYAACVGE